MKRIASNLNRARRQLIQTVGGGALSALLLGPMALSSSQAIAQQPVQGGSINVATIGEPPTLDPMASTADLVSIVTQHMFETLYTFGEGWKVVPLLAQDMPKYSDEGKTLTITLRTGVKFHDGQTMTSADVLASLKRWLAVSVRGKGVADEVASVEAPDAKTIVIKLKNRLATLPNLLAFSNSAAIVLPANKQPATLTEFVGTGPYQLQERKPDQYVLLKRFAGYSARSEAGNFYGGKRVAYLDEIRFVPVPNANTRVEGAVAGQFDYVDALPVEAWPRMQGNAKMQPFVLKGFGMPLMFFNTKEGGLTNVAMRRAVQMSLKTSDMLEAAFGSKDFYGVDGSLYPASYNWHSKLGTEPYNQGNASKAKEMATAAGYDGKPIRILASGQYEFHLKMAQVAAEYLKAAGFKVDLQVVDWATLTTRRTQANAWEIYFTHSPFLPEPALNSYFNNNAPGWWATPAKDKLVDDFTREVDVTKRQAIFADIQKLVYSEVPIIKVGDFNVVSARSKKLGGFQPATWPFFWNTWVEK